MKKTITIIILLTIITSLNAQVKVNGFSFQGIARDLEGSALSKKSIDIKFAIGVEGGSPIFTEEHKTKITDAFGVFSLIIGSIETIAFKNIDLSVDNYNLKVEVKESSSSAYVEISNNAITAIPIAKYAEESNNSKYAERAFFPAGIMVPFAGDESKVPEGWALCDGTIVSRSDDKYKNLYAAIGTAWGTTNSGNFSLPDTRGQFLRGVSSESGNDPDASSRTSKNGGNEGNRVASYQNFEIQQHKHTTDPHSHHTGYGNRGLSDGGGNSNLQNYGNDGVSTRDATVAVNNTGGTETRPKNVYVNYIIKL